MANDHFVHIYAVGEGVDFGINPDLIHSYDNDCIELFFDLKNNKLPTFDLMDDDRQYRIIWNLLKIDGQNINTSNVHVSESDPTDTTYIMEMSFPWKSLGFVKPKSHLRIGFDMALGDNDGETRKAVYSWHSSSEFNWRNTSLFGELILLSNSEKQDSSNASSIYTSIPPFIDGKKETLWRKSPKYRFKHVTIGTVADNLDLSGYFQTLWDSKNLYFIVTVKDNIKSLAHAMFDFGCIKDQNEKIVWKMTMKDTKYAGGAKKNRFIDTSIFMKKGLYSLQYETDESHSPNHWDDKPPTVGFYGIKANIIQ